MRAWNWALVLGAVALVAACGNQMLTGPVDPHPQGTVDAGSRRDAQMGGFGGSSDAGLSPPPCTSACCGFVPPGCPPTAPTPGTPCGTPSAGACEYGDDPNIACNTVFECTSGGWVLEQGAFGENQQASCPTICPPSFPGAVDGGVACPSTELDLACVYPEGVCACLGDWQCGSLSSDCPATRPRAGTPCDVDGGCQTWGFDCGSDTMRCTCGVWSLSVCILL
jgi:hypothetical protein